MILKIASAQPACDYHKQNYRYQSKDRLNKKKSTSFASVLERTIKSKYADIKICGSSGNVAKQQPTIRDVHY
ncbi:hypothetical protein SPTER_16380 [Sporomusa termitida]|uniref:Uncharacterized protein n=1 Tax=Sporomusa termitida TaxID=2377 RepID=A0A517DSH5_9FIRM|nr:hypothetical protein SPTER_16380 [Sporomusa termitida]